jgi:hypothetical protein
MVLDKEVNIWIMIVLVIVLCSLVGGYLDIRRVYCIHLQGTKQRKQTFLQNIVNHLYDFTLCHNPEEHNPVVVGFVADLSTTKIIRAGKMC